MKNFRASHHRHYKGKERERADGTNNGEGKRRVGVSKSLIITYYRGRIPNGAGRKVVLKLR